MTTLGVNLPREALTATIGGLAVHLWRLLKRPVEQSAQAEAKAEVIALLKELLRPAGVPASLVPYIDPIRGSNRTGQIIYQFVHPTVCIGASFMATELEQLIAAFLQIFLAKVDTSLTPATQQLISSALPTVVSTVASVVVDLAAAHTAAKVTPAVAPAK